LTPCEIPLILTIGGQRKYLQAVVCHYGDTYCSGHYVCFIKRGSLWIVLDDQNVRIVSQRQVLESLAYIYVYSETMQDCEETITLQSPKLRSSRSKVKIPKNTAFESEKEKKKYSTNPEFQETQTVYDVSVLLKCLPQTCVNLVLVL
jgi:hypothetical protein